MEGINIESFLTPLETVYSNLPYVVVYKGRLKEDPEKTYAVKEVFVNNFEDANILNLEIGAMSNLKHNNLISIVSNSFKHNN